MILNGSFGPVNQLNCGLAPMQYVLIVGAKQLSYGRGATHGHTTVAARPWTPKDGAAEGGGRGTSTRLSHYEPALREPRRHRTDISQPASAPSPGVSNTPRRTFLA